MSTGHPTLHRPQQAGGPQRVLAVLGALLLAAILLALLVDRIFFRESSPAGTGSGVAATQAALASPASPVSTWPAPTTSSSRSAGSGPSSSTRTATFSKGSRRASVRAGS